MSNLSQAYHDNILAIAITHTTALVITFPLVCYGAIVFYQFRDHLFIAKRFPIVSHIIIVTTIVSGIILNTIQWMEVYGARLVSSGELTTIFVYGLINLRMCLIYLRWKQHKSDSYFMMGISSPQSIYYHWCSISILLFTCISSVYIPIFGINLMITGIAWFIHFMISATFALIILRKHVNEGIGCIRETTILLCFYLFVFVMIIVSTTSVTLAFVAQLLMNIFTPLPALLSLYIPLYYIQKLEGSINRSTISRSVVCININDPFFVFIENRQNYDLFKEYLAHCWAAENLLFYENASILYQIVLKYKHKSKANDGMETYDVQQNTKQETDAVVGVNKFAYLQAVYDRYEGKIGDKSAMQLELDGVKDILYSMHQEIYAEFVTLGSVNQINIAHKTRKQLTAILRDHPNADWVRTFDDFLNLFDSAIREAYRFLLGMYDYQFKSWLEKKNIPLDPVRDIAHVADGHILVMDVSSNPDSD